MLGRNLNVNVVRFRNKMCLIHLFLSIILYCLILIFDLNRSFDLMKVYGVISIGVFVTLLLSELRLKGLNILMIFFLGALLRLAMPIVQMADDANSGEVFAFHRNYTDYIFQCATAMNIYYMLFVLLLTKFAKNKTLLLNLSVLFSIKHINVYIIFIYTIGFLTRLIPDYITFADTLRRFLSVFPTMSLLVLAFFSAYSNDKKSYRIFVILILIEIFYAIIFGFFKGRIMMPLVIYMMYYYLHCKNNDKKIINLRTIVYVLFLSAFLFLFVYPFMQTKRMESQWDPATNITYSDYNSWDIAMRVFKGEARGITETESASDAAASRQNAIPVNSYFYMSALTEGYKTQILKSGLKLPLPRWLGGGSKMSDHQGYLATAWLEDGNFIVSEFGIHSASYVGAFASAFFWGGWPAAILMCMFNAWVLVFLLQFCFRNSRNVFALLILLQLVTGALSCYEEIHDGGISRALNWGVMIMLAIIINKFSNINKHRVKYAK